MKALISFLLLANSETKAIKYSFVPVGRDLVASWKDSMHKNHCYKDHRQRAISLREIIHEFKTASDPLRIKNQISSLPTLVFRQKCCSSKWRCKQQQGNEDII